MGFESSSVARRRLASLSTTNDLVHDALSPATFPGFADLAGSDTALLGVDSAEQLDMSDIRDRTIARTAERVPDDLRPRSDATGLVRELDELAYDIVSTPGAGGALLAAYAAQARALTMVIEAARRAQGAPLPASVLMAAQAALTPPQGLSGFALL